MGPPIFLDANIPIYAAGRPHPLKQPCANVLALVADHPEAFVTDAEVLQELLHRYLALRMWHPHGRETFEAFADLMRERVEPAYASDVEDAAMLADEHRDLGARDLLHAAVMKRLGSTRIVSADTGLDRLPGIQRLDPTEVASWRNGIGEQPV